MENTSKLPAKSKRDVFYYERRNQNRLWEALTSFFAEEAGRRGITKKDIADTLGSDPALITRMLAAPSNLTSDRVSNFLTILDAEMDYRIVRFAERPTPNYVHPLMQNVIGGVAIPAIKDNRATEPPAGKFTPVPGSASASEAVPLELVS